MRFWISSSCTPPSGALKVGGKSSGRCAPRGALLHPRLSREEHEGRFLGLLADLDSKEKGDKSMSGNQRLSPGVWGSALGDPRDMAKAGLPESQSPDDGSSHPPERHLKPAPALRRVERTASQPSEPGAMPNEGIQGDEWDAYVTLLRATGTNVGSPTGRESYWRRRPRSSRRSHARPRRTGKPSTGRREPGDRTSDAMRYA